MAAQTGLDAVGVTDCASGYKMLTGMGLTCDSDLVVANAALVGKTLGMLCPKTCGICGGSSDGSGSDSDEGTGSDICVDDESTFAVMCSMSSDCPTDFTC